ncbi:LytR/AlgR family response regulator transcription factor [Taibaiella koreensis]|uniref:LytR/AlgR family response regulator transcription factor n=1 Tax=Taibaiella koreensis TaxID=1268548 RepID=UPI000E59A29B|nr:LytTR family DNA-binding domain-containing protein [Taibaiella koreensis]
MNIFSYKAMIVDDDEHSRQIIKHLLIDYFPDIEVAGIAGSVADALPLLPALAPDILFLDVELPDGTGFDILRRYPTLDAQVILITAFDHYALKAIKASVIDYVLKPVSETEFTVAVKKALGRCREESSATGDLSMLLSSLQRQMSVRKVRLPTMNGFVLADIDDIIRCEATDNYTILFFSQASPRTVSRTLATYEEELSGFGFIRIHHKHLINIRQVTEYHKGKSGGGYVIMKDKAMLEVSVRKKEQLMHAFQSNRNVL